jgi:hypothetical protein
MKALIILSISTFSWAWGQSEDKPEKMIQVEVSPTIYNGTKSVDGEFLMMGWIGNCTGTAVGKNTIVTASHCVSNGKRITYTPRFNGQSYSMICSRHPRYNDRTVLNDYALCKLESGSFPDDMPLASFEPRTPAIGEKMLLNGYGAPTVRVHHWGPESATRISGQDIVACGRVYLGGGDSGGSLLAWSEDRSGKSGFKVLGINSRAGGGCSYFNRISHDEFTSWAKQYESQNGLSLCGVSATCSGSVPPPPPPPPKDCWQVYEELAFCIGTKSLPACLSRLEELKKCIM